MGLGIPRLGFETEETKPTTTHNNCCDFLTSLTFQGFVLFFDSKSLSSKLSWDGWQIPNHHAIKEVSFAPHASRKEARACTGKEAKRSTWKESSTTPIEFLDILMHFKSNTDLFQFLLVIESHSTTYQYHRLVATLTIARPSSRPASERLHMEFSALALTRNASASPRRSLMASSGAAWKC